MLRLLVLCAWLLGCGGGAVPSLAVASKPWELWIYAGASVPAFVSNGAPGEPGADLPADLVAPYPAVPYIFRYERDGVVPAYRDDPAVFDTILWGPDDLQPWEDDEQPGSILHAGELSFGRAMNDAGRRIAIAKFVVPGSNMAADYLPTSDPLSTDLFGFCHSAKADIEAAYGMRLHWGGLIFNQSGADANSAPQTEVYAANMATWGAALRSSLGEPNLPLFLEKLHVGTDRTYVPEMRAQILAWAAAGANRYAIDVDTVTLIPPPDPGHYDSAGSVLAGELFAAAVLANTAAP